MLIENMKCLYKPTKIMQERATNSKSKICKQESKQIETNDDDVKTWLTIWESGITHKKVNDFVWI